MAKSMGKRAYHRADMKNLNRTALIIGGAVAAGILLIMVVSLTI